MYSFLDLESVCYSTSSSNCCFLTCIQISQEAGQVVCYSHLCQNFLQFIVILSHVQLFANPWTTACQASLSITNSQSLLKLRSIESVMPSNPLILWKILKEMEIPDHLTCLLRRFYAGQEAIVRTEHRTTDWFKIRKGIHQGCKLSPCFFNLYAEYIM